MKHYIHILALLFLVFLISTSHTSARKLTAKQEEPDVRVNNMSNSKESVLKMGTMDSFDKLMGLEECENEDEECLKRRVLAEAHLDYIYTQQHKP
ncbi:hypothetical protein CDL12_16513 [Handroanthus impetiginosus]|uniref:Phytosulfokine n=1 Tax=Handroanthus impetiginosus TaxID=429701 RepID=A0A2G9H030_9LAMI|nr:hypothetical protein CDL12_16513 [Handroanthus impetiginosus]